MRDIPAECKQMVEQLEANGYSLHDLTYHAQITEQTFKYWRDGINAPTLTRWDSVQKTFSNLLANQIKVPRRD